ncbi:MAG: Ig-like domain-containing protein [Candidatus Delongbacteria bacterium]|nr:Ig-like domain-containing protein [Candidatus Delongbacteria bacterium]
MSEIERIKRMMVWVWLMAGFMVMGSQFLGGTEMFSAGHPFELSVIVITPSNPTLQPGQSLTFTAEGRDQSGQSVAIQDPHWEGDGICGSIAPVAGSVPPQCVYTASGEGSGYILCYEGPPPQGGVNGSTDIAVKAGSSYLARIEVSPNHVSLQVGQQQQFTATGYDQNGNVYQVNPIWSSDGGTISQDGNYTATVSGDFTVSASNQSQTITGSAGVHVEPVTGIDINGEVPNGIKLFQNSPNPFHLKTSILFFLSSDQKVCLAVFDVCGKEIAIIANQNFPAGFHSVEFNSVNIANGVYFFRMTTETFSDSRKMILIR